MYIDLIFLGIIVLWVIPCALELSTVMFVGGCGWPISFNVIRGGMTSRELKNMAASSASEADTIIYLIMKEMVSTASLLNI